jgi:ATP-dependent Clp protease ATP-binding subunit ClpA
MLGRFSEKAQKAMAIAESIAFDLGHSSVGSEHLLLSLLKIKESKLRIMLLQYDITFEVIKDDIIQLFGKKDVQPFYMEYTSAMKLLIENALNISKKYQEEKASIDILTYALLTLEESVASELLNKHKVDLNKIRDEFKLELKKVSELDSIDDLTNLNNLSAKEGALLIGQEVELNQLTEALLRKQKPNALLIGEPGVGKTALVNHLAYLINEKQVPDGLKDKTIYELDIASTVAGTKYRGEFEEKLKKTLKKVKEDRNAIIFIDEIHNIIGAGGAEGAIDASNIIKPYLSRGEIQIIGATTYDEYVKTFEKEKALERRFQIIHIAEPDRNQVINILEKLADEYQRFHNIKIDKQLLRRVYDLTDVYVSQRFFPDKAIDVLDCACVRAKQSSKPALEEVDIIQTIEDNYKITINQNKKAVALNQSLKNYIVGQTDAIERITNQIRLIENGLVEENRPLGVFMFVGPTGVGKTEVAKLIAKHYFGEQDSLIKIDMAEFMEPHSVSKLIGSPPGYVGHENQTYIVDKIRKKPHCVLLLDEIEKAHKEILDIFLNVFDEGYFIDANKRKIDFKNTIIIMTSNLGYYEDIFHNKTMGYVGNSASKSDVNKIIKKHFRPEFINRIDEIIQFESLDKETCVKLASKYLNEFEQKLHVEFALEENALDTIVNNSEVTRFGARGIKRSVKKFVINELDKNNSEKVEATTKNR